MTKVRPRQRSLYVRSILESLEPRQLYSAAVSPAVESITGANNNLANASWGVAGTDLIRLTAAAYTDGIDSPNLAGDLSARTISNLLNNQADPANSSADIATIDQNSLSDFGYGFGQFMDHDLDLTNDGGAEFDITLSSNDPIYPGTGNGTLTFTRSQTDPTTGTSTSNPAQQTTMVTAYLDLSQVYGSDDATALALRTMTGGLMKTSAGNLLPYLNSIYFTADQLASFNAAAGGEADLSGMPTTSLFATGDVRGNENLELTTLTTLFVRNHNLIATELQAAHPDWNDQQLYDEARKINIADYQKIIYNEWMPDVYGKNAMPKYSGYKSTVNASISNEFSTVAYRFGHSMVSPTIERQNNDGTDAAADVPLSEDFFDPNLLSNTGAVDPYTGLASTSIDPILKAMSDGDGQAMDMTAVGDIRNLLFADFGGVGGDDLMARDVQRGRDNGIPDYNTLRTDLGLKPVTSFAQITSNVTLQQELAAAYPGGVNTIDAFEGGLAEDPVKGSDVGQLFQTIMINQFTRLRDGDRFYFGNEKFNAEETRLINSGDTLTKVIEANTSITNLQADSILFKASIAGTVVPSQPSRSIPSGVSGLFVQLLDSDGDVVATTTTDRFGNYSFNQLSTRNANVEDSPGVSSTGNYTVVLTLADGSTKTSTTLTITAGDTNIKHLYFKIPTTMIVQPPSHSHHGISMMAAVDSLISING